MRFSGSWEYRRNASRSAVPVRRSGRLGRPRRPTGMHCLSAPWSRARTWGRCSMPTKPCSRVVFHTSHRLSWPARPLRTRRHGSPESPARLFSATYERSGMSTHPRGDRSTRARSCSCNRRTKKASGCPVLEAMTVGVPVVAAGRGALPEVLGDAGLLADLDRHAEDAQSLTGSMLQMLGDEGLRASASARGVARARAFHWAAAAEAAHEAYDRALHRRRLRT